ncbi:hypothetical protein [Cucumibacter marinus]|uniref:hypothetical protein n=1 Tax=Cucumibacter marinus TaxID=1121252 RepID=UPI00049207D6|nr:hypothetical protein [Cucumibacter marinus]
MKFKRLIHVIHRWTSAVFVLTVIGGTYAAATGMDQSSMLYYLPLPPLFLLLATGLYMFVLHYANKLRGSARTTA